MTGALSTSLIVALFSLTALRPPIPRRSTRFSLQFAFSWQLNELPFLGLWWLLAGTIGTLIEPRLGKPLWWLIAALVTLNVLVLVRILFRARSARPVLSAAFEDTFGTGTAPCYTRAPWWRIVLLPVMSWRRDVRRIRNRRYGPARHGNRLDVYVSRRGNRTGAPVLVYLHGGGFVMGSKMLGAHHMIYRLAARGWVCISADYRLFRAGYADQLADARAALAWTHANVDAYGGDPHTTFIAGGSAGAHLAATAALSGAEVSGVIGLYGYYGNVSRSGSGPTSPTECIKAAAPPFLIVHGTLDTLVRHQDARSFADRLRAVSRQPVAYAELPATNHNFDLFPSARCHTVTDAVARFAELTMAARSVQHQPARTSR